MPIDRAAGPPPAGHGSRGTHPQGRSLAQAASTGYLRTLIGNGEVGFERFDPRISAKHNVKAEPASMRMRMKRSVVRLVELRRGTDTEKAEATLDLEHTGSAVPQS
jgi:hypothetical protein